MNTLVKVLLSFLLLNKFLDCAQKILFNKLFQNLTLTYLKSEIKPDFYVLL
jgi:hypothetical protein